MGNVTCRAAAGGGHGAAGAAGGRGRHPQGHGLGTDRSREGTGHGERQEASCWFGEQSREGGIWQQESGRVLAAG